MQRNATQHNITQQALFSVGYNQQIALAGEQLLAATSLKAVQNGWHCTGILKWTFSTMIQISLTSVSKGQVDKKLALVHASAWFGQATRHWL